MSAAFCRAVGNSTLSPLSAIECRRSQLRSKINVSLFGMLKLEVRGLLVGVSCPAWITDSEPISHKMRLFQTHFLACPLRIQRRRK